MSPDEGIEILGQAIEQSLIKLAAINAVQLSVGVIIGFLAGRVGGKKDDGNRERNGKRRRDRQSDKGCGVAPQ